MSNQLSSLVPTFDPATDDLVIYQQKVELVLAAWPKGKLQELVTRLILGCKGTAFQKLQIHQTELLKGDEQCVRKLIEHLGGQWGKIPLERQYEDAEQALYHTIQKSDEANDSYLARADVMWSRLLARKMTISEIQAYVVLRGSLLTADEKKRVIMDSEVSGQLTMKSVHEAIKVLGASFFHEMTGRKATRTKIYDGTTLMTDTTTDHAAVAETEYGQVPLDETTEAEFLETLVQEGDPDALLIADFEAAAQETVQEDSELATAFSAYQQARHRLGEKFRNRGFFPARPYTGKGKGYGGKPSGKGKFHDNRPKKTLQERIMSSTCRLCGVRGHWKAECPLKNQGSANSTEAQSTAPTSTVITTNSGSSLPLEFLDLPETSIDEPKPNLSFCFTCEPMHDHAKFSYRGRILGESRHGSYDSFGSKGFTARDRLRSHLLRIDGCQATPTDVPLRDKVKSRSVESLPVVPRTHKVMPREVPAEAGSNEVNSITDPSVLPTTPVCFATHDAYGVLDLGASKTVIGSEHVKCLIRSLDEETRARLSRCPCQVTFKFGNQGTLTSSQAIVVPIGHLRLKIAIVEGGTPFLISNTFMRAIRATIDCSKYSLSSPVLNHEVPLELTERGLFLVNLNDLVRAAVTQHSAKELDTKPVESTFLVTRTAGRDPEETSAEATTGRVHNQESNMIEVSQKSKTRNTYHEAQVHRSVQLALEDNQAHQRNSHQPAVQVPNTRADHPKDISHVSHEPTEGPADRGGDAASRSVPPDTDRPEVRSGDIWIEAPGRDLRESLGGPRLDQFHGSQVQQQPSPLPSKTPEVCGIDDRAPRANECPGASLSSTRIVGRELHNDQRGFWAKAHPSQGQGHASRSIWGTHGPTTGSRRRTSFRDVQPGDYGGHPVCAGSECHSPSGTHAPHGKCPEPCDQALGGPSREGDPEGLSQPEDELIAEACPTVHQDVKDLQRLIHKITKEFQEVQKESKPIGKPFLMGEIFCSGESPLTQQIRNLGHQSFRFGLAQGDLSTTDGRQKLFRTIECHRPKHLWYSPVCGPWSSWSALNASKSIDAQWEYQQKRHELRYQIALGIVLYRYQISKGLHFSWEQPQRSLMMIHPGISEIHQHTQTCQFDMCEAGDLKDPVNHHHIKKGMQVATTHEPLFRALHGLTCRKNHDHQQLEGSTCVHGHSILRTKFSEIYPRKFVRLVAKTLNRNDHPWPFHWRSGIALCQYDKGVEAPALAASQKRRVLQPVKNRSRDQFVRSQLATPEESDEAGVKRRRLDGKQGPVPSLRECQEVFQEIQQILPRVGKREIQSSNILQQLQSIFPDRQIITAMACRGTDRTLPPPDKFHHTLAPYRKTLMILRPSGEIKYEKEWERWSELSNRRLIRPAHPCRINVTVFAKDFEPKESPSQSSTTPVARDRHNPVTFDQPMPANFDAVPEPSDHQAPRDVDEHPTRDTTSTDSVPKMEGQSTEIRRSDQGSYFHALPKWEQSQLITIHKNLGHPSNERLARALQFNGQRPEMVKAALELKCSICANSAGPKHQRPGSLKPLLDFNHRIYLDGIKWTNHKGQGFQMYHIVDAGTHFHTAFVAPSHTTRDVISLLSQHWMNWAGAPQEMKVDSGTELNSEEFQQFLQRFSIRCTTIAPEAHWQNGTIERHGGFLQHMLSKVDMEIPIESYQQLQLALNQCCQAKNSMMIKHGYSPEIMVFGKQSRLPGSVLSDASLPAHTAAIQENAELSAEEFRTQLKLREVARKAFHTADNSNALRRAMLRRSCPSRGQYSKGQWVMIWRSTGPLKQSWIGPHRVIVQDENHTIWTTQAGRLYRSAPENVRLALPEEGEPDGPDLPEDMTQIQQQINRSYQNPEAMQSIPEHEPIETPLITGPSELSVGNLPAPTTEQEQHDSSASESLQQPDQEPEAFSRELTQNLEESAPESPTDPADSFFVCSEEECALTSSDNQHLAWRCEYDMIIPHEFANEAPTPLESWILLATNAKKQRTEVRLSELTPSEREEFKAAKQAEVHNWIKTETLSVVMRDQIPADQILRCRWILTWKPLDVADGGADSQNSKQCKAKARIVVLGYLDPHLEDIPRDSPTLGRSSRMVILQTIASHGWHLQSFDIKAAFLQGQPQKDRLILIDPVNELRDALNTKSNEIAKLQKGAYGLIDAPYLWYCALVQELTRLGMESCPFDPCVFVLREDSYVPDNDQPRPSGLRPASGPIIGVLGIHVDDGICGGNQKFQQVIQLLEQKYPFGAKKMTSFTFTGIEVNQDPSFNITLSQSNYIRKISPIPIEVNRKTQPELPINEKERGLLRGLIGSLQYASTNTRPDLANRLSTLQSQINSAQVETLAEANRLLHEAKKYHDTTITIKSIPHEDLRFMVFSDASFASSTKPYSYAGSIIVGTHKNISQNVECPISPLIWGSKKIQKVVTSTLSAETISMASALDQLSWLRLYWKWLHDPATQWHRPEDALLKVEPAITVATMPTADDIAVTDCKSLHDLITRTAPPQCSEFRVQLVARAIKETLREGINLRWVHTGAQLADALTKAMEARFLRETLKHGSYRLCDEQSMLKERAKTRDRIKWLKQQSQSPEDKKEQANLQ